MNCVQTETLYIRDNSSSRVLKVIDGSRGKPYVVKLYTNHTHTHEDDSIECENCRENLWDELEILKTLKKHQVCNVPSPGLGVMMKMQNTQGKYPGFTQEYINRDFGYVYNDNRKEFLTIYSGKFKPLFKNLLKCLKGVHLAGVVHCDVKPQNIMFNHLWRVHYDFCLIDFGASWLIDDLSKYNPKQRITTWGYISPENILGLVFGPKIDIYALAITMLTILTSRMVFNWRCHRDSSKRSKLRCVNQFDPEGYLACLEEFHQTVDASYLGLIRKMVESVPVTTKFVNKLTKKISKKSKKIMKIKELFERLTYVERLDGILESEGIKIPHFRDLIVNMLKFDPRQRYSVDQCLNHKFFICDDDDLMMIDTECESDKGESPQ